VVERRDAEDLFAMIQSFLEAAGRAASGHAASGSSSQPPPESYAVLPQQSEDDLMLSEVHTRLDSAFMWLQREVGYALLDDARSRRGGGVRLTNKSGGQESRRDPKTPRREQTRLPRDGDVVEHESSPGDSGEEGRSSKTSCSTDDGGEIITLSPDTAKSAWYPEDVVLVWRFAKLLAEVSPEASVKVKQDMLYEPVLKGIRLLHLCDYHYSDVVVVLAHAGVYFKMVFESVGDRMSAKEAGFVSALLIYLAHAFVLDETCPMKVWQQYVFRKYCNVKVMGAAVFRLLLLRKYSLLISEEEEKHALNMLQGSDDGLVHINGSRRLRLGKSGA
jgi:hypothetical protein